jgi:hypothetical protein
LNYRFGPEENDYLAVIKGQLLLTGGFVPPEVWAGLFDYASVWDEGGIVANGNISVIL